MANLMNRATLLAVIFLSLTASVATASDISIARVIAGKDYEADIAKINADYSAASEKCGSGTGPAVEACLIQSRGKRMRTGQEAKRKMDRVGQTPPSTKSGAKAASLNAHEAARKSEDNAGRYLEMETRAANAECRKITGEEHKTCTADVAQRSAEAREAVDGRYKRAKSDARAIEAL
jgi:hypothetical protein